MWTESTQVEYADLAGDTQDRKSTSGYIFQLGKSTIAWSRKQSSTALSTEAEYIAATYAIQETNWLRHLLRKFGYQPTGPTLVYEDNMSCIQLAQMERINQSKHIDIKYHYVIDELQQGHIIKKYCPTR